jgi:hypothetical protein
MQTLTIVLTKQVVLTEKISSNIKKRTRTTECHLSSHTILRSVIYPTSFLSTGQPYKTPRTVQNVQRTTRHGFQETQNFDSNGDLDLCSNDPKLNRVLPLPQGNHVTKFL